VSERFLLCHQREYNSCKDTKREENRLIADHWGGQVEIPALSSPNSNGLCGVSCFNAESTTIFSQLPLFNQSGVVADYWSLPFFLIGKGDKGLDCGILMPFKICDNPDCGKLHWVKHNCRRKACPDCYKGWIREEVDKAYARLLSKESLIRNKGKRLVHIILSPNQDRKPGSREELRELFNEGYEYIKNKGAVGGICVFHAFRATKMAKRAARKAHKKDWVWIRAQKEPEQWYKYSPHLHLISFINHLAPAEKEEAWVYKQIPDKEGSYAGFMRKAKREKEIKGAIGYLLTHAVTLKGAEDTFHSVRWFGSCSYNKFITTEEEKQVGAPSERELHCKLCGGLLIGVIAWYHRWFEAMDYGDIDKAKYWPELLWLYGERGGIEPTEAERRAYLIGGEVNI
jgi:hypothetical protein